MIQFEPICAASRLPKKHNSEPNSSVVCSPERIVMIMQSSYGWELQARYQWAGALEEWGGKTNGRTQDDNVQMKFFQMLGCKKLGEEIYLICLSLFSLARLHDPMNLRKIPSVCTRCSKDSNLKPWMLSEEMTLRTWRSTFVLWVVGTINNFPL